MQARETDVRGQHALLPANVERLLRIVRVKTFPNGPSCSKLGSDNPGLVRDLNSDLKLKKHFSFNSFCLQIDDWKP